MRKLVALVTLTLAFVACGCAPATKAPSGKTLVKCTTCGVEFSVEEGISAYEAAHDH